MSVEKLQEAAKAVVAAIPVVAFALVGLVNAMTDAGVAVPPWLATVVAFATSLGVYFKANKVPEARPPTIDTPGE